MKNLLTIVTVATILLVAPVSVSADSVETKTECTTGAYGHQTCKTVEVKKVLGEATPKNHVTKDAGLAENVMFMTVGLLALSSAGLAYSRRS